MDFQRFKNRVEAGQKLADGLAGQTGQNPLLLALPRGGVVVARPIAEQLGITLDVLLVRKLGVPNYPELAMGAIAEGGAHVLNHRVLNQLDISEAALHQTVEKERAELDRRGQAYRNGGKPAEVFGRDLILVDDGLATGSTMQAAIESVQQSKPASITVAIPVAPPDVVADMKRRVAAVVCLSQPEDFGGVGRFYEEFPQVSDDEVRANLAASPQTVSPEN